MSGATATPLTVKFPWTMRPLSSPRSLAVTSVCVQGPPKVECPEVEITAQSKEISFPLKLDAAAPAGTHKNLFCQIVITQNGEPVVHNLGSSELRIDVPIVAKAAPSPAAAPKAAPAAEKRLSRLEQLRKEQEEREKAGQKKD